MAVTRRPFGRGWTLMHWFQVAVKWTNGRSAFGRRLLHGQLHDASGKKRGRVQPLERRVPFRFLATVTFKTPATNFFVAGNHVSQPRVDPTVSGRVWLICFSALQYGNVEVSKPGWSANLGLVFPYSRLAILAECPPRRRVAPMPHATLPSMLLLCFRASLCSLNLIQGNPR